MNNDNFLIESSDIDRIKKLCGTITDSTKRSLAFANALAAELAKKYFTEIELDSVSTLHEIPQVLERIDIADIYIKNNYIDVRLYFEDEEPSIPREHVSNGIEPLAYMFIKVNKELTTAIVTGFIITSNLNYNTFENDNITISESDLVSYYDLENALVYNNEEIINSDFEVTIFDYLDGKLIDTKDFYTILTSSPEGREKLKNAAFAQQVFEQINLIPNDTNAIENNEDIVSDENNEFFEEESAVNNENINLEYNEDDYELTDYEQDNDILLSKSETSEELNLIETNEDAFELNTIEDIEDITFENNDLDISEGVEDTSFDNVEDVQDLTFEDQDFETSEGVEDTSFDNVENVQDLTFEDQDFETSEGVEDTSYDNVEDVQDLTFEDNDLETPEDIENSKQEKTFSTNTTPSLKALEADNIEDEINEKDLIDALEIEDYDKQENIEDEIQEDEKIEEINILFNESSTHDDENSDETQEAVDVNNSYQKNNSLKFISILAIIAGLGYFGYTKFYNVEQNQVMPKKVEAISKVASKVEKKPIEKAVAMPNETVENSKKTIHTNEAVNTTIPAIENNLDVPIVITNLSINWEVPSSYVSSNTAKRYFTKLGKILQLNLKTELLLLNKQPLSNKISVELTYNKTNKKFETKGIIVSSEDKLIDEVIINTINNALDINLNSNMSTFDNFMGNPILVIHL